jgi:hypothetical protein
MILMVTIVPRTVAHAEPYPSTVHIFHDHPLHFSPDDAARYDTETVTAEDNGRMISRAIHIDRPARPVRITAHVVVRPVALDDVSVHDKWDRAANVRLRRPGAPDIEILKFITAYGGITEHRVDVTHLAPLLRGACTFLGFVDTWTSPGWTMDFDLLFEPVLEDTAPTWVESLLYSDGMTAESLGDGGETVEIEIPANLEHVALSYLASGHCTDGRGADEFETKDNVIAVDGVEAARLRPWRDDCERFRDRNPYCRRWSDGSWSADYSRSGWCPGDKVEPLRIDLSAQLTAGRHTLRFHVEGVRPKNADGDHGYWRVSSYLAGW